jgi:chemotaxis protein histidine kinase CheA
MRGEIFTDAAMLEIFRAEVETHVESLTSGLLALERDPDDTTHIDEMMRGAHSIKGASRIVGVEPAVRIAHAMEDGFVAARNGKLVLRPEHVDVLLRGVDMLNRIANGSRDSGIDWSCFDAEADPLVTEIIAVLASVPRSIPHSSSPSAVAKQTTTSGQMPSSPLSANEISIIFPEILDAAAAETARREYIAGLDGPAKQIRFDLSATKDLDATGLAFLAAVPAHACADGKQVELTGVAGDLQSLFAATGIDRMYPAGRR